MRSDCRVVRQNNRCPQPYEGSCSLSDTESTDDDNLRQLNVRIVTHYQMVFGWCL